jgi:hypothetical protein
MHAGTAAEGEQSLQSLRDHGQPVADLSATTPYVDVQRFFDADYPAGGRYYWKSQYLRDLSDEAIDRLMQLNLECPSPHSTIDLWQLGGALSRVAPDATAFGDRSAPFLIGIESNWHESEEDEANIAWARKIQTLLAKSKIQSGKGGHLGFGNWDIG